MTPRYYAVNLSFLTPYDSLEAAQRAAESLDLSPGEEAAILVPIGITRRSVTTTWLDKPDVTAYLMRASTGWSWPTLPHGHSYLNPENLTVEQLGDGWRPLCTLDERFPEPHEFLTDQQVWTPGVHRVVPPRESCSCDAITYRTRAPIPTLPSNH